MLLTLSLALVTQAQAQNAIAAPGADLLTPQVVTTAIAGTDTHDAIIGQATQLPTSAQDDDVPLPVGAVWRESANGDVLVQPASGDPFFLGFAAGKHFPALDERIDPKLIQIAATLPNDGRPTRETYAFVMFNKRMTEARVEQLKSLGARVLQFHPHYCLKVAVPVNAIDALASLDFVRWIGVEPSWQKVHPILSGLLASSAPQRPVDVWISVFESDLNPNSRSFAVGAVHEADPDAVVRTGDAGALPQIWMSNGWQQRALENLGVEVIEYADTVRSFRARVTPAQMESLLALDLVQFVEADMPEEMMHDESMPLINADRTRVNHDGCSQYTAHVGVIDSGMYISHLALDPFVVGWEYSTDSTNAFDDGCAHGSHVSGTILGNGDVDPSWAGAASGSGCATVARVFVGKIFSGSCSSLGVSLPAVYTQFHTGYTDGSGNFTARPHVINNSYNITYAGTPYIGSEVGPRLVDDETYDYNQLYVFAAGNSGSGGGTLGDKAASKNAMTVGSVIDYYDATVGDPGTLWTSSSRGPTGDDRWKPNVAAPGRQIWSVQSGTSTGYVNNSGTSMACPHVTGTAAQLIDRYAFLQYNPAALSAVLMAGAITKNDATLGVPSTDPANHLNMYGAGRIDAYKAAGGDSQQALYMWSWTESTSTGQVDFPVNAGATRVTIVMHYKEESSSAGASAALVNNLDTYIDVAPFTVASNSGEYTAQQSPRDNTEIRIINNPTVADWRIKVYPTSVVAGQVCKVGVCAIVTYGDTTPTPTLDVSMFDPYLKPNQFGSIAATYTNPTYIASAVYLDASQAGAALNQANTFLIDGATADLTNNQQGGWDMLLGDVVHGTSRSANWRLFWATEGIKNFSVTARSDNAVDVNDAVSVYVDGTPPPLPTGLRSTTHTPNVWSRNPDIAFAWTQPADPISGVDGYSWTLVNLAVTPDATKDINAVTSFGYSLDPMTDTGSYYFNLRPVDRSGNWNASFASVGPFRFDFIQPDYVTGLTSSTHAIGSHSCNPNITVNWNPTPDSGGSGLAGYYWSWSHVASEPPGTGSPLGVVTSYASTLSASSQPWYFHITPFDNAGNSQNFFNVGPFYIVNPTPTTYCTAKTNSLGCVPAINSTGTPSKSAGAFTVGCTNVVSQKNGLCFWGRNSLATPFQGGWLCVAAPTVRTANISSGGSAAGNDCTGTYSFNFNTAYMTANAINPGDAIFAQFWMRDPPSASTTGLSNAIQFTVCD